MTGKTGGEGEDATAMRRMAGQAVRRLDVVEYALVGAAAVLALVAGAGVAFLLAGPTGLSFRLVWAAASLLLFGVPALASWIRNRETGGGVRQDSAAEARPAAGEGPEAN